MRHYIILSLLFFNWTASATHLRAGYIRAKQIDCGLTFQITLTAYVNNASPVLFGSGGRIRFGDGTIMAMADAGIQSTPVQPSVGLVQFTVTHTYPALGAYRISYAEANRDFDIVNIGNSVNTPFYMETEIVIDPQLGCFSSPEMIAPAIFTATKEQPVSYSFAASNPENIVYSYALVTPLTVSQVDGNPVPTAYTLPENATINPINGLFSWDTKYQGMYELGEYVFTIKITMWKKQDDGTHFYLGHTSFDTQVNVIDNLSLPPDLGINKEVDENGRLYVPSNESISVKIICTFASDKNTELLAYSELAANAEVFSFTTHDSVSANHIKVGRLTLHSTEAINREAPYLITLRGLEKSPYHATDLNIMFYTRDVFPETIIMGTHDAPSFNVYPNPTSNKITIQSSGTEPTTYQLINGNGKPIVVPFDLNSMDLSEQPQGLYILQIKTFQHKKVIKVIKQ